MASRKLHQLIKTLSKNEKRLFRLYLNKYKSNKNKYDELLGIYFSIKTFDSAAINEVLKQQQLYKNKTQLQNFLYKQLLNFLASQSKLERDLLWDKVKQAKVLYRRNLPELALKIINDIKPILYTKEYFVLLQAIIILETNVYEILKYNYTEIEKSYLELIDLNKSIGITLKFWHLNFTFNSKVMLYDFKDEADAANYMNMLSRHEIFQLSEKEQQALPTRVIASYYRLGSIVNSYIDKTEEANDFANKYFNLISARKSDFVATHLSKHSIECFYIFTLLKKKDHALKALALIDSLDLRTPVENINFLALKYRRLFDFYTYLNLSEVTQNDLLAFTQDEELIGKHVKISVLGGLYFSLIRLCMHKSWLDKAQKYINILKLKPVFLKNYIISKTISLYEIIIFFEQEINSLFVSSVRSFDYNYKRNSKENYIEIILIKYLNRFRKTKEQKKQMILFKKLAQELKSLPQDIVKYTELDSNYLFAWIDSKIHNCSIETALLRDGK